MCIECRSVRVLCHILFCSFSISVGLRCRSYMVSMFSVGILDPIEIVLIDTLCLVSKEFASVCRLSFFLCMASSIFSSSATMCISSIAI